MELVLGLGISLDAYDGDERGVHDGLTDEYVIISNF